MLQLPGYQIRQELSVSANSLLYRAERVSDAQPVILKLLNQEYPSNEQLARYRREYEMTRSLDCDGVVRAFALEPFQHRLVLVLEDFGGIPLQNWYRQQVADNGDAIAQFFPIALRLSEIIGSIHQARIIHKDLKPSNILINPDTQVIKLIDFGISTLLSRETPSLLNPGELQGTLAYLSPEQTGRMNRNLDYRTDFYSLGVTFYELLTGELPFVSDDPLELVHSHIARPVRFPPNSQEQIPLMIQAIVQKLMAKNAEDRYQTAWGLRWDLQQAAHQWQTQTGNDPFVLGTQDRGDRLMIPQKLYGREFEVQTLLQSFERILQGAVELLLVAGYSGIGKSALVAEVHKPMTASRGYFIAGKFERLARNIPYSAIVQAFTSLVQQLLGESAESLAQWRRNLQNALGENGQAIVELVPILEQIIGVQPPLPELGLTESQNRFNRTLQNFLKVFCSPQHPLVMFLDDLQWADSATLSSIELWMRDSSNSHLLIVGAYRDNEVDQSHPLTAFQANLPHQQIHLKPLNLAQVSQLVGETLHQSATEVQPLATWVQRKTEGNPFFIAEFLKILDGEGWLRFDPEQGRWIWDEAGIAQLAISENVVDSLIMKLRQQPSGTQEVLSIAACIGAAFSLSLLAKMVGRSPQAVFADLQPALDLDLIVAHRARDIEENWGGEKSLPLGGVFDPASLLPQGFHFSHDLVQQAAYQLIPLSETPGLHWRIGELLWQGGENDRSREHLFTLLDHLNLGRALAQTPETVDRLIRLNQEAGQRAIAANAYHAATEYLAVALELLSPQSWETDYQITLEVYLSAIEAKYLNSQYYKAIARTEIALKQANSVLDRLRVYELAIQLYTAQNRPLQAVECGLQALSLAEIDLETPANPDFELPTVASLGDRPEMEDPVYLAAGRIFVAICPSAYFAKPLVLHDLILKMVELTREGGNFASAAYAYVWYAALSCAQGDIQRGYQAGELSLAILEQYHAQTLQAKVYNLHSALVRHWREPARNNLDPLQAGIQSGLDCGDHEYASYCIKDYCVDLFLTGYPLDEVNAKMSQFDPLLQKLKFEYSIVQTQIWRQVALNFSGEWSQTVAVLEGTVFNAATAREYLAETNNQTLLFIVDLARLMLAYYFGEYEAAHRYAVTAHQHRAAVMGFLYGPLYEFYKALTLLAIAQREGEATASPGTEKPEWDPTEVAESQRQLQHWAQHCPENFQNKWDLVEAERISFEKGDLWLAGELYERAIAGARSQQNFPEEALAWERAAHFYLRHHREAIAVGYFQEAHYCYRRWGATAKVAQLEQFVQVRWGRSFPQTVLQQQPSLTTTGTTRTSSLSSGQALDVMSMVRSSQAIASEIQLDKLLAQLLTITVENAGAQKAVLILSDNNNLKIEAVQLPDGELQILESLPLETSPLVPCAIINYVARTQETIILADATRDGLFTSEPYILQHKTQSLLCTPIINQGKFIGILYLENNLLTGAFTPERIHLLQVISAQAAISLENAQLYRTLEDKVTERTAQIAEANEEISTLNERLKSDNLRMSAELDITRQLQHKMLPNPEELQEIPGLEIAGFMEPADEVGGDYYDVLNYEGRVKIGIGDVTGHGLESGMVMLMVQTAVRTLLAHNETDFIKVLSTINRTIYDNVGRMDSDKNLSLVLLDYAEGILKISGQHEEIIVIRANGEIELVDTVNLGFPIGLVMDISEFITQIEVQLNPGDGVVLYTDGITEAANKTRQRYGLERLCKVASQNWQQSAEGIRQAAIDNLREFIGDIKISDDITLVVLKQQ
ncbi:AAA family ATPase [Phormidium pseudopriestleyi FRX01]|uniref:AAA family ATPase n=1 Tax=Phormidium pseudopriestleyi FRX01 TaxID=1759528 RepID=A0ABS3FYU0_9CYAN|nr:AAA family ATPase [Phormidium pseudopriestleyi]MBO0352309.1 AAA family ATPase [Phormidium pseudopriestleyi FRX01]